MSLEFVMKDWKFLPTNIAVARKIIHHTKLKD